MAHSAGLTMGPDSFSQFLAGREQWPSACWLVQPYLRVPEAGHQGRAKFDAPVYKTIWGYGLNAREVAKVRVYGELSSGGLSPQIAFLATASPATTCSSPPINKVYFFWGGAG